MSPEDPVVVRDIIITSDWLDGPEHGWYLIGENPADAIQPELSAILARSYEAAEEAWIERHADEDGLALDSDTLDDYVTERDGNGRPQEYSSCIWTGSDDHNNWIAVDTQCIVGSGPHDESVFRLKPGGHDEREAD